MSDEENNQNIVDLKDLIEAINELSSKISLLTENINSLYYK